MKMSNKPAKYELLMKQYLRSILDTREITEEWRFLFEISHFRFRDSDVFLLCKLDDVKLIAT